MFVILATKHGAAVFTFSLALFYRTVWTSAWPFLALRAGARPAPRLRRTLTYPFGVSRLTPTVATPEVRSTERYGCQ